MTYRILFVEDEKELASSLQDSLTRKGYEVDIAYNGEEGWQAWQKKPYDLVLLDLVMPKLTGSELLTKIHQIQELTPIIIISGEGTEADKLNAVNQHAFAYIEKKDLNLDLLLNTIEKALNKRSLLLRSLEEMVEHNKDPDKAIIAIGSKTYSPNQLFDEARMGTAFGKQYLADLSKTIIGMRVTNDDDEDFISSGIIE